MLDFFFSVYKHVQLWMRNITCEQVNARSCSSLLFEKFILMVLMFISLVVFGWEIWW